MALPITKIKIALAKILYRLTTALVGKEKKIVVRNGITYEVDLSEGIDLSLYLFGNFQKHITSNPYLKLKPDGVVFDVGANFGIMCTQFAKACPQGRVIAFEPTHYALGHLKRNLELNPDLSSRVEVINSFVSEKSSADPNITAFSSWKVDGFKSGKEHPLHLGTPHSAEGVPAISLDDFTQQRSIQRLDLIKIDTDGHEYEVLLGARKCIAALRPFVLFEIGQYGMAEKNIGFSFYTDYFGPLGYKMYDTKTHAEVTLENHLRYLPAKGTTDLIAVPGN